MSPDKIGTVGTNPIQREKFIRRTYGEASRKTTRRVEITCLIIAPCWKWMAEPATDGAENAEKKPNQGQYVCEVDLPVVPRSRR